MSSEAPVLHRILGTNVLPNWSDRFGRNITPASSRALRDLQSDVFQGHWHIVYNWIYSEPFATNVNTAGSNYRGVTTDGTILGFHGFPYFAKDVIFDGVNDTPRIDNETRPMNFALMYQIVRG